MTKLRVENIGLCAEFSPQGDWAFDCALSLAQSMDLGLRVFGVADMAWDKAQPRALSSEETIALDRRLREYYDERLGDFVEAGFRVCEGVVNRELRSCLVEREYQMLVLAYRSAGAIFAGRSIEEFAISLPFPVVLAGPERPDQLFANPPALLLSQQHQTQQGDWAPIELCASVLAAR